MHRRIGLAAALVAGSLPAQQFAEDELLRRLAAGDVDGAAAILGAMDERGLAALPRLLDALPASANPWPLARPLRALHRAHGDAVEAILRERLIAGPDERVVRIARAVAPAILAEHEVLQAFAVAGPQLSAGAVIELARAVADRQVEALAVTTLLDLVPLERRQNALGALAVVPGTWRTALWPSQRAMLTTQFAWHLVPFFAPVRAELPQFVDDLRRLLAETAGGELLDILGATLGRLPGLAAELAPALEAAVERSPRGSELLFALAQTPARAAMRLRILDSIEGDDPAVATSAMACCAAWHLVGDDVEAALRVASNRGELPVAQAARWLLWSRRPGSEELPRPWMAGGGVAGDDVPARFAAIHAALHAPEPLPRTHAEAFTADVGAHQLALACAALRLAERCGLDARNLARQFGQRLGDPNFASEFGTLADALVDVGEVGADTFAAAMVRADDPAPFLRWLATAGARVLPAATALAALGLRTDNRPALSGDLTEGALAAFPADVRLALREPRALLQRVLGDARLDVSVRVTALRALLCDDEAQRRPAAELAARSDVAELRRLGVTFLLDAGGLEPVERAALAARSLGEPSLRRTAVQTVRELGTAAQGALADVWLRGDLPTRALAGALLRERQGGALPPMPAALAAATPVDDPAVRLAIAASLAAGRDVEPAIRLLRELLAARDVAVRPPADPALALLADVVARTRGDLEPHVDLLERVLAAGPAEAVRSGVLALERCGATGHEALVRVLAGAAVRREVLQLPQLSGEVGAALLATLPTIPEAERQVVLDAVQRDTQALRSCREAAPAARAAWAAADSWVERARLVPILFALELPLAFVAGDVDRMLADPRGEVVAAGRQIAARLGDEARLDEMRREFAAGTAAERLASLRAVRALDRLPPWVTGADLLSLAGELSLRELLLVASRWQPTPGDAARAPFARWLLSRLGVEPRPSGDDLEAAAPVLLRLRTETRALLVAGGGDLLGRLPHLVLALGRRDPRFVHSLLADVAEGHRAHLLHAIGRGEAPDLLPALAPRVRVGDLASRAAALAALPATGDAGLHLHLSMIDDPDLGAHALHALPLWGRRGAPAVGELVAVARRGEAELRAVLAAFAAMGSAGVIALEDLARDGVEVGEHVFAAIASEDEATVVAALRALIAIRPAGAAKRLAGVRLGVDSATTRSWREVVLARLDDGARPGITGMLRNGLCAEDPALRAAATTSLGTLDGTAFGVRALLVECLWDEDAGVRLAAATALRRDAEGSTAAANAIAERLAIETDDAVRAALQPR